MKDIEFESLEERSAYEQGYGEALMDVYEQLGSSKLKILSMQLGTEPYSRQRHMLMACTKLLEIYERHYKSRIPCQPPLLIR